MPAMLEYLPGAQVSILRPGFPQRQVASVQHKRNARG